MHRKWIEPSKHGRYRTDVWSYAGVNSFGSQTYNMTRDRNILGRIGEDQLLAAVSMKS